MPAVPVRSLSWPWQVELTEGCRGATELLDRLLNQTLAHGMPAHRHGGRIRAAVARRGRVIRGAARLARRDPELDHAPTIEAFRRDWQRLAQGAVDVPSEPGELGLLVLERATARLTFVLSDDVPVMVHKVSEGSQASREADVLRSLVPVGVTPRPLGPLGDGEVQEALPGTAPHLRPWHRGGGKRELWEGTVTEVAEALQRIGVHTVHDAPRQEPRALADAYRATTAPLLGQRERDVVQHAADVISGATVRVVSHGDPSPQNWVVDDEGHLTGLIDLEMSDPHQLPGWDVAQAATAWAEHRGGLRPGTQDEVVMAIAGPSPLAEGATAATLRAVLACGGDEQLAEAVRVSYHASRLGRELARSGVYAADRSALIESLRRVIATSQLRVG